MNLLTLIRTFQFCRSLNYCSSLKRADRAGGQGNRSMHAGCTLLGLVERDQPA